MSLINKVDMVCLSPVVYCVVVGRRKIEKCIMNK